MPNHEGQLNTVVSDSLLVGSNQALFINLKAAPQRVIEIWHINWGYSFLVTPIPTVAADYTYGSLKFVRNRQFDSSFNYGDAFGSNAAQLDMLYQDILVGPTPNKTVINFFEPLRTREGEDLLIVVSAPLSSFAGSFGATLLVRGNYAPITPDTYFPYQLR